MKTSIMVVVIGALIQTIFLCNTGSDKKIKRTENIHEHNTLAIVEDHRNSKRHCEIRWPISATLGFTLNFSANPQVK